MIMFSITPYAVLLLICVTLLFLVGAYDPETYKSDREQPRDVKTQPDYPGKGIWATPKPESGIDLGFVPIRTYAQVRHSHTVKHLPRDAALSEAKTYEEVVNAPRLREVVSTKKISEVYSEEGYEDSGYDHGGFGRQGEAKEGYQKHHDDSDVGESEIRTTKHTDGQVRKVNRHKETSQEEKMVYLESPNGVTLKPINIHYTKSIEIPRRSNQTNVIKLKNPQIIYNKSTGNLRVPKTNYSPTPYSSKGRIQLLKPIDLIGNQNQQVYQQAIPLSSVRSYLVQNPLGSTPLTHIQNSPGNQSPFYQTVMPMRYYQNTLVPEYNFQNREASPVVNIAENPKSITKLNLMNLNKDLHPVPSPRPLGTVYPVQNGMSSEIFNTKTPFHIQGANLEPLNLKMIIPNQKTILNINALADLTSSSNRKSKYNRILSNHNTRPLGSEKAMYVHLLTSTHFNSPENVSDADLNVNKNNNGIRYVTSTQFRNPYQEEFIPNDQQYEQTRRSDDIIKQAKYLDAEEEEKKLKKHEELLEKEKDFQLLRQIENWSNALKASDLPKRPQGIDTNKFPFYYKRSSTLSMDSPLRYAMDPKRIPIKTEGGMEFYESRDIHHCSEVKGPGKVIPERGADGEWNKNPRPKLPRLQPLGDKIDCFKVKYFGTEPLDNPFFQEKSAEPKDPFYKEIMETINNLPKDDIDEYSSATMLRERQAPVLEEIDETPVYFKDKTVFPGINTENDYNGDFKNNKPIDEITFTTERPNSQQDSFLSPPSVPSQDDATESYHDKPKSQIRNINKYPNDNKKLTKLFLIVPKKADVIYITPRPKPLPLPDIIYGKPNIPLNKPTIRSRPDSIYSILANISRRHPRFALNEMLLSESRRYDVKSINETTNSKDINRLRRFGRNRNIVKDNTEKNVTNDENRNTTNVTPLKKTRVIKTRLNRNKMERNLKDKSGERDEDTNKNAENNYQRNKETVDRRRGEPRYRDDEGNISEWQESRQGEVLEVQATSEEPSNKKKKQIEALINRNKPRFSSRFRIENLSKYETTTQTLRVPNEDKDKVSDTTTTTTTTTTTPTNRLNSREKTSNPKINDINNNLRSRLFERGRSRFSATVPTTTTTTLNPLNFRVRPVDRRKNKRVEENKISTTTQSSINNNSYSDDDFPSSQSNNNNNKEENIDKEFKKSEDLIEEKLKKLRDDSDHLDIKENDYNDEDKINSSLDEISINENDSSSSGETFKIKELSNRVPTEEEIKSEQSLEDLPRRLKSFERRKVTKEEIITRTFVPEKEESLEDAVIHEDALPGSLNNKDFTTSLEEDDLNQGDSEKSSRHSMRNGSKGFLLVNSKDEPKTYKGRSMTYAVNPKTGTGKWIEKIEEDSWESDGVKRQKNPRESDVFSRAARQRQKNENVTKESEESRLSSRRKQIDARRQRRTRQNRFQNEDDDIEEREESTARSKIIKDPGQRLYYFANK